MRSLAGTDRAAKSSTLPLTAYEAMLLRPARLLALATFACTMLVIGCEVTDALSTEIDFGDPYVIATETTPPAVQPRLDAEGLHLTVQYSGGCKTHAFFVQFLRRGDTTEVWLRHDARADPCEAYLTETLTRAVPMRVLDTEHVVLLAPDGASFKLR